MVNMDFITIIIIAVGLAMDAFAVSIVSGSVYKALNLKHAFRIASFFGAFQAFMPLVGALAGLSIKTFIADYDHWAAFGLLSLVGAKMIYESFKMESSEQRFNPTKISVLLVLSVATSIDALAVGVSLSLLSLGIIQSVIIIGTVTFILSLIGVRTGTKLGHFFENKIEAIGGLILIGLGVKILLTHLF